MTHVTTSRVAGPHFKLSVFVCDPGRVVRSSFEGWVTFPQMYAARPEGCGFIIAQRMLLDYTSKIGVVFADLTHEFAVWDISDKTFDRRPYYHDLKLFPPNPLWVGESLEGLIMKAVMTYATGR